MVRVVRPAGVASMPNHALIGISAEACALRQGPLMDWYFLGHLEACEALHKPSHMLRPLGTLSLGVPPYSSVKSLHS